VDCVARLATLAGVPDQKRNDFDWPAIESSLGLSLPDDYQRLVETFPDGIFQGLVRVNRRHRDRRASAAVRHRR